MPETFLLYGETDSGKSAQARRFVDWHHRESGGEITRAIIADSTVAPYQKRIISPENPDGIIEAVVIRGLKDPHSALEFMAKGYWPELKTDSKGTRFVFKQPTYVDGKMLASDGKRKVGQYIIEGLATISEVLLQDHADHAKERPAFGSGEGGVTTFKSVVEVEGPGGRISTEESTVGRAVAGHFGWVQNFVLSVLVPRFSDLKAISRILWTSHTSRGKDQMTGIKGGALGPATIGPGAVDRTAKKFGHTFHLESETKFGSTKEALREFRAWFLSHPDSEMTSLQWPSKVSLELEEAGKLLKRFPKGYIPLTLDKGMEQYLEFLAEAGKPV